MAVSRINRTGAVLTNIVCDNPPVNHAMLKSLGASLDPDNLNPTTRLINVSGKKIYAFLDPPHLIKLTRNALGDYKTLLNSDGHKIHWHFIERLHSLQNQEGHHLANKLNTNHVEYHKNKMKVSYAAQTLSQSVANAIWFCCKDLNLEEFKDAEPTVEFIKCFDILFDRLNSKDASGKFSKAPIFAYNELYWRKELCKCSTYIRGLRYEDGKSVFTARRRVKVFTGWLNNIEVFQRMFDDLVKIKKTFISSSL